MFEQNLSWADVRWLKEAGCKDVPLVVKGIMTGDDAKLALEAKADGIMVSFFHARSHRTLQPIPVIQISNLLDERCIRRHHDNWKSSLFRLSHPTTRYRIMAGDSWTLVCPVWMHFPKLWRQWREGRLYCWMVEYGEGQMLSRHLLSGLLQSESENPCFLHLLLTERMVSCLFWRCSSGKQRPLWPCVVAAIFTILHQCILLGIQPELSVGDTFDLPCDFELANKSMYTYTVQ